MTFLIVICAIIGIILIINYNGNKHDEEMKKLAAKKRKVSLHHRNKTSMQK